MEYNLRSQSWMDFCGDEFTFWTVSEGGRDEFSLVSWRLGE